MLPMVDWTRSEPAAARSRASTRAVCCAWARRAPGRSQGRCATAPAARSSRPPTRRRRSDGCAPRRCLGGRMRLELGRRRGRRVDGELLTGAAGPASIDEAAHRRRPTSSTQNMVQRDRASTPCSKGYDPRDFSARRLRRRRPAVRRATSRASSSIPRVDRAATSRHHVGHRTARVRPEGTRSQRTVMVEARSRRLRAF